MVAIIGALMGIIQGAGGGAALSSAGSIFSPVIELSGQAANRLLPVKIPDGLVLGEALRRGVIDEAEYSDLMRAVGVSEDRQRILRGASKPSLPATVIIELRRRGRLSDEEFAANARLTGLTPEQLSILERAVEFYPSPQDIVTFLGREAFEQDSVDLIGLDDQFEKIDKTFAARAGVSEDILRLFWRSHWTHPSFTQIGEMLRRGLITEDVLDVWFNLVEIPPYWRDNMAQLTHDVFARVDIRRMWDMGVLDDAATVKAYIAAGFSEGDAAIQLLYTKAERLIPDLRGMYRNGWISEQELISRIRDIGIPQEASDRVIQTIIKNDSLARTAVERDLTKAEIVKGAKLGIISQETGEMMLQDMGYSPNEALYILAVGKAVTLPEGSVPIPYTALVPPSNYPTFPQS